MTLQELYEIIQGDYDQAKRVLQIEKLMDKHIRKFESSPVVPALLAAGETMDGAALFEAAHAVKGVCGNLGLTKLAAAASDITEEFRPGVARAMTDEQVKEKLGEISRLYALAQDGIRQYAAQ